MEIKRDFQGIPGSNIMNLKKRVISWRSKGAVMEIENPKACGRVGRTRKRFCRYRRRNEMWSCRIEEKDLLSYLKSIKWAFRLSSVSIITTQRRKVLGEARKNRFVSTGIRRAWTSCQLNSNNTFQVMGAIRLFQACGLHPLVIPALEWQMRFRGIAIKQWRSREVFSILESVGFRRHVRYDLIAWKSNFSISFTQKSFHFASS
jgi:hypothetical protein